MSRVDVFVPCYKYGHYLRECVESVLTQSHGDVRVLIIDDASPDNTEEVARELTTQDPRVDFRRHSANQGHIATYNEGLEWASGEYTLLLSADDLLTPGSLERSVRSLDDNPTVGMVHGRGVIVRNNETFPRSECTEPWDCIITPGEEFVQSFCETGENRVITPTAVVRTCLQKSLGFYRKDLPHSGDMEMWLRFAGHAPVGFITESQAYYRKHDYNMSRQYMGARDFVQQRAAFQVFFDNYAHHLRQAGRLHSLSRRQIADNAFWSAYHAFEEAKAATCKELLAFAVETNPDIRTWKSYSRLCWKLAIGPKVWTLMGSIRHRIRRKTKVQGTAS